MKTHEAPSQSRRKSIFSAVRHKLGQKGRKSSTIRQESTVCYSRTSSPFVRLDAVQPEKSISDGSGTALRASSPGPCRMIGASEDVRSQGFREEIGYKEKAEYRGNAKMAEWRGDRCELEDEVIEGEGRMKLGLRLE